MIPRLTAGSRTLLPALALLLACVPPTRAADPDTARGEKMLDAYFRRETQRLADACLADLTTRADWEKRRPELRRQFLDMLGLWPLPPRTDLKPVVTGKLETDRFTVEKLYFQSMPGLYVTANLYVPKHADFPAPAVLYVCGHGPTVVDNVSYGTKVTYQHHPAWFAEHGYVCLILDTLELGEIQGVHHGTYRLNQWWWQSLGYTPAGVECWNGMRALDYLQSRKEVDPKRLGVTGRSGGGATSWWVAAADERVQCIVPVAGITDLWAHVVGETPPPPGTPPRFLHGVVAGHCDCMYFTNTYQWDFPQVAALCAPRPLLLGNSDADDIFPVPGYRRLADKVRRVYDLYGAGDRFALLETKGPHKDTPELRLGAYRWMNRWLKNDTGEVTEEQRPPFFTPAQLKVFDHLPEDQINTTIQDTFIKPAAIKMPEAAQVHAWWKDKREELLRGLREKVFRGWPANPPALDPRLAADVTHAGLRLRAYDFVSEENVELRLWVLTAAEVEKPMMVTLTAVDEAGWQELAEGLGPAFKDAMQLAAEPKEDAEKLAQTRKGLEGLDRAMAIIAPRGIGPTRWAAAGSFEDTQIRRRFALLGQTLDGQRVWDVRRAVAVLRAVPDLKGAPLWLQDSGDMAGIALYAGLFEPDVASLELRHPPASHRQGPTFLNVLRVLDMPQAVALAASRPVGVYVKDDAEAAAWDWPLRLQKALGEDALKIRQVGD